MLLGAPHRPRPAAVLAGGLSSAPAAAVTPTGGDHRVNRPAPCLGVGVLFNPSLPEFLRTHLGAVDHVGVIPETFWTDRGPGRAGRFREIESSAPILGWLTERRPLVAHGLGLSIGSARRLDVEHLAQIASWRERHPFRWYSEHLSFVRIQAGDGREHDAGLALPLPYDREVLELLVGRVAEITRAVPVPFLLENHVSYVGIPDQEMTEPRFLNELCARTGCGLLLDLHNLHTNATNHKFDPYDFLRELDLDHVLEIHVAGGNRMGALYTDSHAGACPEEVWRLLDFTLPRANNVCAVTFEFHESYYSLLGEDGILEQLHTARRIWSAHRSPANVA